VRWLLSKITYRPDGWEVAAVILTIAVTFYWLSLYDFHWKAFVFAAFVLVFGGMSGDMLFDLWRRK
jgi:hypothetical protein